MRYNVTMETQKQEILKQILYNAKQICRRGSVKFTSYRESDDATENCFSVYLATNENCAYFPKMTSFEDKDVLSVTGSGDHALNAVFFGAKSVETFDINRLAFLFCDLKETALLHLTRSEFVDFYDETNLFPHQLYDKVSPFLKSETKEFFDGLFEYIKFAPEGDFLRPFYMQEVYTHSQGVCTQKQGANAEKGFSKTSCVMRNLIEEFGNTAQNLIINNPYLVSEKTYKETQNRLKLLKQPVGHKFCPAHKIGEEFEPKDVVILSNVLRFYLDNLYFFFLCDQDDNKDWGKDFVKSLSKVMKEDAVASMLYEYSSMTYCSSEKKLRTKMGVNLNKITVDEDDFGAKQATVWVASKSDLQADSRVL